MYVDKSALPQYQTDNYLLLDGFDSNSGRGNEDHLRPCANGPHPIRQDSERNKPGNCKDSVHFTNNPPDIGNNFTVELRFQFNDKGYFGGGRIFC